MTCLILLFLALAIFCHSSAVDGGDTIELGAFLSGNRTILSKNGTFELGFFTRRGTSNWYIGIWYAQISEKTIVWVANRNTPITNMPGVMKLGKDGNLRLFDLEGRSIWSTDNVLKGSRAVILDSGNFVMLGAKNTSEIVWESFRQPTDTWLPGIKQWEGLQLTSWKSSSDPASGPFSFHMESSGEKKQILLLYNNSIRYWYSGEWTGNHFSYLPELLDQKMVNMSFVRVSRSKIYFIFVLNPKMQTAKGRLVLDKSGQLRMCFWVDNSRWNCVWSVPHDQCDAYDVCGAYGACNSNNIQFCSCIHGFRPKNNPAWNSQDWWSSGCVRRRPLQCSDTNGSTDVFMEVSDKSFAVEQAVTHTEEVTRAGCESACLNNCSCTAFAISGSTPSICRLWFGDLRNAHDSSDGQSVFIRLAASELPDTSFTERKKAHVVRILLPAIAAFTAVFAMLFAVFVRRRRRRMLKKSTEDDVPTSLRAFTYKELQIATENFKYRLGSGAFGTVFKGSLPDNTLVAVKQLEGSVQAEKQFRAEINTIGNIQHVNLVRLRGFCAEQSTRLLVYEYMSNGSLNSFLFHGKGKMLDWKTRFQIALGTARGLVYLHEECRDRIIHCDIKPDNILLDDEFCPKVADFGMAKLVGRDFSRVLTTARGTRGYLAPEWIYGLPITPKADVYSFGITLLEIISGRRNWDSNVESSRIYFATWAACEVEKGNIVGVVDGTIADKADVEQVRRATVVSELCIQEDEDARPNMGQILQILEGRMEADRPQILSHPEVFLDPKLFFDEEEGNYRDNNGLVAAWPPHSDSK